MTKSLKLSLIAFTASALFAGAAQAEDIVRVSLTGKDANAVHAELIHAARMVCASESPTPHFTLESDRDACMRETVAKAEADYRQMKGLQMALAKGE
jgi:hypothetical protein